MKRKVKIFTITLILIITMGTYTFAKYENSTWDEFYDKFYEEYQKNGGKNLSDKDIERAIKGPKPMQNKLDEGALKNDLGALEDIKEKALGLQSTRKNASKKNEGDAGSGPTITEKDDKKAKELQKELLKKYDGGSKKFLNSLDEATTLELYGKIRDYYIAKGEQPGADTNDQIWQMYILVDDKYEELTGKQLERLDNTKEVYIYRAPDNGEGKEIDTSIDGLDSIVGDAEDFVKSGKKNQISEPELQKTFDYVYNILLQLGIGISVVIGIVLAIKFILAGIEEKAEVKKMLGVYVIACIVIFGSFGIWKLVVNILGNM